MDPFLSLTPLAANVKHTVWELACKETYKRVVTYCMLSWPIVKRVS